MFHSFLNVRIVKQVNPMKPCGKFTGSFVRLTNNEVAVITKRPVNGSGYQMKAILSPRGGPYAGCFSRDSSLADHKIEETVQPDTIPSLNLAELWGYLQ
jgi:hypothetical protein